MALRYSNKVFKNKKLLRSNSVPGRVTQLEQGVTFTIFFYFLIQKSLQCRKFQTLTTTKLCLLNLYYIYIYIYREKKFKKCKCSGKSHWKCSPWQGSSQLWLKSQQGKSGKNPEFQKSAKNSAQLKIQAKKIKFPKKSNSQNQIPNTDVHPRSEQDNTGTMAGVAQDW